MQIKTTMRYNGQNYTWSEWPSSKNLQTINAVEDWEKAELPYTAGWNVNWYSVWKTV